MQFSLRHAKSFQTFDFHFVNATEWFGPEQHRNLSQSFVAMAMRMDRLEAQTQNLTRQTSNVVQQFLSRLESTIQRRLDTSLGEMRSSQEALRREVMSSVRNLNRTMMSSVMSLNHSIQVTTMVIAFVWCRKSHGCKAVPASQMVSQSDFCSRGTHNSLW